MENTVDCDQLGEQVQHHVDAFVHRTGHPRLVEEAVLLSDYSPTRFEDCAGVEYERFPTLFNAIKQSGTMG